MFQRRNRGVRGGFGLLLLLGQLYNFGFNRIPPVTLAFIAGNVGIFLRLLPNMPRLGEACVSAHHVWYYGDWTRLILAPFFHLDDWHLYYNMASFLWKGKSLETRMGSGMFLYLLAVFSVLTSIVLVGLDIALANLTGDASYLYSCAAGFSGVIFALKVITTYEMPSGVSMVMGMFPVPVRYACWAELLLIQFLVPNASFTGHLAGIIVGLLYVKGPLKSIMNTLAGVGSSVRGRIRSSPSYTYQSGSTGTRRTNHRTAPNDSDDDELQAAIRASLRETHATPPTPQQRQNQPPYPTHNGENDPAFQAAIEASLASSEGQHLDGTSFRRPPRGGSYPGPPPYPTSNNDPGMAPPPPYSEAANERLYPRIPDAAEYDGYSQPSAPPYDLHTSDGNLPYPTHNAMPFVDDVRQRRLRRFEN